MKIVLQGTVINHNVTGKLGQLFNDPVAYHIIWNTVYSHFADTKQIENIFKECRSKIAKILEEHPDAGIEDDEFYIIASGGVLWSLIVADVLRENGIDNYKYLVYEPQIHNYVVIDRNAYLEKGN